MQVTATEDVDYRREVIQKRSIAPEGDFHTVLNRSKQSNSFHNCFHNYEYHPLEITLHKLSKNPGKIFRILFSSFLTVVQQI